MGNLLVPERTSGLPLQNASVLVSHGLPQNQASVTAESKPKKKICCARPETKKLRDECIVEHGEAACAKWIEAHCQCLRAERASMFEIDTPLC